jgi:hypothetical protein
MVATPVGEYVTEQTEVEEKIRYLNHIYFKVDVERGAIAEGGSACVSAANSLLLLYFTLSWLRTKWAMCFVGWWR